MPKPALLAPTITLFFTHEAAVGLFDAECETEAAVAHRLLQQWVRTERKELANFFSDISVSLVTTFIFLGFFGY